MGGDGVCSLYQSSSQIFSESFSQKWWYIKGQTNNSAGCSVTSHVEGGGGLIVSVCVYVHGVCVFLQQSKDKPVGKLASLSCPWCVVVCMGVTLVVD